MKRNNHDTFTRPLYLIATSILMAIVVSSVLMFSSDTVTRSTQLSGDSSSGRLTRGTKQQFDLAHHESLGFFDDIDDAAWKIRRSNTLDSIHHEDDDKKPGLGNLTQNQARVWYATNWNPDFACFNEVSVGGISDGHKYLCDPHRLANLDDCLIYSIGSNGNFDFERGMNEIAPNCEIHVFDVDDFSRKMQDELIQNADFHAWGLKGSYDSRAIDGRQDLNMMLLQRTKTFLTLQETMMELGHIGRRIDVFKIDCEGCEWTSYRDWLGMDIRQIAIETHNIPPNADSFFENLHSDGYVMYHKEPNIEFASGNCVEFSFLKLHEDFFVTTNDGETSVGM